MALAKQVKSKNESRKQISTDAIAYAYMYR